MKKVLLLTLAMVLALGLALPMAIPAAADPQETLYLSDSAVKGDGKTYLYTVELVEPDRAELTLLPQATNLDPPLGPGEIPFEQVDALACTPDGKKLYAIDKPTTNLGYYDLDNSTWNIVESSPGVPAPTGIPECVLAAFSFDDPHILYAASDSTDSLYTVNIATAASTLVGEIWDDKGTIDTSDDEKVNVSGADLVWGAGPTLYLWANNPGSAPRGLYTLTLPDPPPGNVLASHLGEGSVGSYFTGLAIRERGAGDLVGSTHEDQIMQIDKTNGDTLKTYMMYLGSSTEVYDYEYGDMTVGELVEPSIDIVKSGPYYAYEGDTITYDYAVHNDGEVPLDPVTVTDSLGIVANPVMDDGHNVGDTSEDGILDPCETWMFTAEYTIPEGCDDPLENTATATGYYGDVPATDEDSWSVDILHKTPPPTKNPPPDEAVGGEVYRLDKLALMVRLGGLGLLLIIVIGGGILGLGRLKVPRL